MNVSTRGGFFGGCGLRRARAATGLRRRIQLQALVRAHRRPSESAPARRGCRPGARGHRWPARHGGLPQRDARRRRGRLLASALGRGADDARISDPIVAQTIPVVGIDGTGFAFPGYKALWAALDGDLGTLERAAILQNGLYALAKAWDGGFRQVTTGTKPVASPDDLRRLDFRVPEAAIPVSLFRALGASPTPIAASEMYTALQTKVVDGQENPLINIETNRIYEVQKYCSLTSHMWNGHWLVVNGDAWNALPKPVQTSVETRFNAAALAARADIERLNRTLQDNSRAKVWRSTPSIKGRFAKRCARPVTTGAVAHHVRRGPVGDAREIQRPLHGFQHRPPRTEPARVVARRVRAIVVGAGPGGSVRRARTRARRR